MRVINESAQIISIKIKFELKLKSKNICKKKFWKKDNSFIYVHEIVFAQYYYLLCNYLCNSVLLLLFLYFIQSTYTIYSLYNPLFFYILLNAIYFIYFNHISIMMNFVRTINRIECYRWVLQKLENDRFFFNKNKIMRCELIHAILFY